MIIVIIEVNAVVFDNLMGEFTAAILIPMPLRLNLFVYGNIMFIELTVRLTNYLYMVLVLL